MVSMSPRWVSLKLWAETEESPPQSVNATRAGANERKKRIAILLCESRCPEIPNFVSVNPELRVFQYLGLVYFLPLSGQLLFWPGKGFAETMSSALTHPGVPTAKRVLARDASSRAVLLSPRR